MKDKNKSRNNDNDKEKEKDNNKKVLKKCTFDHILLYSITINLHSAFTFIKLTVTVT